jgi:hypothetical protein
MRREYLPEPGGEAAVGDHRMAGDVRRGVAA